MAIPANVFGKPITESIERARVALNMKTADLKDIRARTFVENLKKQYGNGVSALCLVYNATGNTITYANKKDWHGHIWNPESQYPERIQNGQWGAFLHVHPYAATTGSMGAAVYRGKDGYGNNCDYMMAWMHPWTSQANTVHCETREVDHFNAQWNTIDSFLENNNNIQYSDRWNGCLTNISTGSDPSALVEATFTLEDAA